MNSEFDSTLPATVRVIGQDYALSFMSPVLSEAADSIGYVDHHKLQILVRSGLPPQKLAEVLLHEIFHALLYATHSQETQPDGEEAIVDRLGRGMACVMRDNAELFDRLHSFVAT